MDHLHIAPLLDPAGLDLLRRWAYALVTVGLAGAVWHAVARFHAVYESGPSPRV